MEKTPDQPAEQENAAKDNVVWLFVPAPATAAAKPAGNSHEDAARRPGPAEGPAERRRHPRRRVLRNALLVFRGGYCTMGCQILDTSEGGALLMPADITLCPEEFVLKPTVGPARACEVVWRRGARVGVRHL